MNEPIKAGDECIVVNGASGPRNQVNLGRRVVVLALQGEHSRFGRIWLCRSQDDQPFERIDGIYAEERDLKPSLADFAASWLRKPDPIPPKETTTDRTKEVTA